MLNASFLNTDSVYLAETKAPPAEATSAPPHQTVTSPAQVPSASAAPLPVQDATGTESTAPPVSEAALSGTDAITASTYSLQLAHSDVAAEMEKRKSRAERFGITVAPDASDNAESEAARALERAKRFGTGQTAIGKLDEALPDETERGARKKARAKGEASAMDDPGLRSNFRGLPRSRGSGNKRSNSRQGQKPTGVQKQGSAFLNDKDRMAAEARKKRFANAS